MRGMLCTERQNKTAHRHVVFRLHALLGVGILQSAQKNWECQTVETTDRAPSLGNLKQSHKNEITLGYSTKIVC